MPNNDARDRETARLGPRMRENWQVLSTIARDPGAHPTVQVVHPDASTTSSLPPLVLNTLAEAAGGGPAPEVLKYLEAVDGAVVRLVDDGSELPSQGVLHLVVSTVALVEGNPPRHVTYTLAARPAATSRPDLAPLTPLVPRAPHPSRPRA